MGDSAIEVASKMTKLWQRNMLIKKRLKETDAKGHILQSYTLNPRHTTVVRMLRQIGVIE